MGHSGGRRHYCLWEHCNKVFNRKADLCRHYRIHTNERPYHCTVKDCNKSFIQRSALTVHSRIHTGEKPHVCEDRECREAFSDSSSLARHRKMHTGIRPYISQESTCKRMFRRKTTLTKHQERSHSSQTIIPSSSRNAITKDSDPGQVAIPISNEPHLSIQHAKFPYTPSPIHDSHAVQSLYVAPAPVQDQAPIVTQPIIVASPVDIQRAQQYCMWLVRQPHHGHVYQEYLPLGFQQPYCSLPIAECPSLIAGASSLSTSPSPHEATLRAAAEDIRTADMPRTCF
ncbi:C2H2-type zinc finger protein [Aspergillus luchuensis]|uniref:C2H2-type domain-containing protein n=1 Tax=Aspergillus kawachii TaxID=1069201 RepID=A0A7R7W894_ASPKA|nr:uncharacterized protein AKAW2_31531S [Aspergillus luchuensis]BCR98212.1 hypothetical protein AKAW2_31531S [Aspergillus luchuensis]